MKFAKQLPPFGEIIAEKKYGTGPAYSHLRVVIVKRDDAIRPFVVWEHNMALGGFHHGDYCKTSEAAFRAFSVRGSSNV